MPERLNRLLAVFLLCVATRCVLAQRTFTIIDLGALSGDAESFPVGVNNRGDVSATSMS